MKITRKLMIIIAAALMLVTAQPVQAKMVMRLSDGTDTVTIADNGLGDLYQFTDG